MTRDQTSSIAFLLALGFGCTVEPELSSSSTSLAGSDIDGRLRADPQGEFLFDEEAQLTFDYFLVASDELTPERLDEWVATAIAERLSGRAREGALEAWRAYFEYRRTAASVLEGARDADAEQQLLAALDHHLGRYPIAASERAQITSAFAEDRSASPGGQFLEQLQAIRAGEFGEAAAERLRVLDLKREEWERRVSAFRGAREELRAHTPSDRVAAAIAALEASSFTASELRRVRALDRLRVR
jgi:lipase chaperone LimK